MCGRDNTLYSYSHTTTFHYMYLFSIQPPRMILASIMRKVRNCPKSLQMRLVTATQQQNAHQQRGFFQLTQISKSTHRRLDLLNYLAHAMHYFSFTSAHQKLEVLMQDDTLPSSCNRLL